MSDTSKRVMVAMSGGVDSSVTALLLRDAGWDIIGMTALLASKKSPEAEMARAVCDALEIEHVTIDLTREFEQNVMTQFCVSYINGETPNPCVTCNHLIKFGAFDRVREELGADKIATGHYVRTFYDVPLQRWLLLRGTDERKDQSYFLGRLSQGQLSHALFPLGNMTKDEVRAMATEAALPCASRSESQDICFIADGKYVNFIERFVKDINTESNTNGLSEKYMRATDAGNIIDLGDNVLGKHTGLINYTIGQRKGIGIAAPLPLYVTGKDTANNQLIVGDRSTLLTNEVCGREVNYIAISQDDATNTRICPLPVTAKTTYRATPSPAQAIFDDERVRITFDEPITRPAPGQLLAIYDESSEIMLASAVI